MDRMAIVFFFILTLLSNTLAFAQSEKGLKSLADLAPEYQGYRSQAISSPVSIPNISLKVIGRVNRFAQLIGGRVGAVPLDDTKKEQAAKTFENAVIAAISEKYTLKDDSNLQLVVASGEGGGIMMGYGGIITAQVFLIDIQGKTLLAYSDAPVGKGITIDQALKDLAMEVNKQVQQMARQAKHAQTPQEIAKKAFASSVVLVMEDENGKSLTLGSGFFVRDGEVASNRHVIKDAARGYAKLVGEKTKYDIEGIIAVDPERDLVVLKVSSGRSQPLPLGNSDSVQIGESIFVVGSPQGLEGTFSQGIISSIREVGTYKLLQITAPISQGSSGGPVINERGEVIGVSVATYREGQNLNFAIPSNYLKALVENPGLLKPLPQAKVAKPQKPLLPDQSGGQKEFKIGMTCNLSGPQAQVGATYLREISSHVEKINAAGNIKVRLIVSDAFDSGNSATMTIDRVQKLMNEDVLVILSPAIKSQMEGIAALAENARIPVVFFTLRPEAVRLPSSEWVFLATPSEAITVISKTFEQVDMDRESIRKFLAGRLGQHIEIMAPAKEKSLNKQQVTNGETNSQGHASTQVPAEDASAVQAYLIAARKAMDEYKPSLKSDRAKGICGLAGALAQAGASAESKQIVTEVLTSMPKDEFALRYVTGFYAKSGDMTNADATIAKITDPQHRVWARIDMAVALYQLGRVEESKQVFSLAKLDAVKIDPSGAKPSPSRGFVQDDASGMRAFLERDISISQAKLGLLEEAKLTASGIRHQGIRQVAESNIKVAEIKGVAMSGHLEKAKQAAAQIQDAYFSASANREIASTQAAQGDLTGAKATLSRASEKAQRATPEFLRWRAIREIAIVSAAVHALAGDFDEADASSATIKVTDVERISAERTVAQIRSKHGKRDELLRWVSTARDAGVRLARIEGLLQGLATDRASVPATPQPK